ncbi:rRNA-processing protein UTP23 -like protein [Sarcoptes scabiei]|uniref:rRNA-processing protein UTP23 homolog n=1 Tax=Sarcoptes scabiei TaxID=52283 RepID=A0A132A1R7_SARSC|nr:rRNA-processing protein UTP23 -like protein [Sarcoptes scabiei]KPM04759.1 rRNA-processing protein UTP23-like protein [Sarcoptes scabiei]
MKITRYKRAQKCLVFYRNYFNFRPPYQILLDATFCQAALKNKIDIKEQIPKYLNDQVKLLTTVCVVTEIEKISHSFYGAMLIIKQFPIHKCGHEKKPIAANECLYSLLERRKSEHYFLATQDPELTNNANQLGYVPILFIKLSTIILERPGQRAKKLALESNETFSNQCDEHQFDTLKQLKELESIDESKSLGNLPKRKRCKGPNPLSCKKKKKTMAIPQPNQIEPMKKSDSRRKRKRIKRIPNHIKRMFKKIEMDFKETKTS